MRVLLLNAYFPPEKIAYTHLEQDIITALLDRRHEIEVLCPMPTRGLTKETVKQYRKLKNETLHEGCVNVRRFWAPQEGRNPLIRAFRYFWCNLRQYQIGKKYGDIDLILAVSTPPTQGWLAAKLGKKLNRPFIYDLQDMFPESLVSTGMTRKGSLLWKIGNWVSNETYCAAEHIIVICDSMKESLIKKGVPAEKISVVYNWIDTEITQPIPRTQNPLFEEFDLNRNQFIVTYAGNLGNSQNVQLLVECAEALKNERDIYFVIFGSGTEKEKLEKSISERCLDNIHLLPLQSMEKVSQVYSLGDVSFVICKKGVGEGAFPSKAASIMAAGTPIVASFDTDSDLSRMVEKENTGICTGAEDVDGAVVGILKLYNDRELCKTMGQNARKLACDRLSKKVGTAARVAIYEKYARK